jgi:hypothetical protein
MKDKLWLNLNTESAAKCSEIDLGFHKDSHVFFDYLPSGVLSIRRMSDYMNVSTLPSELLNKAI